MDIKVIATTHIGHEAEKVKFDEFAGKMLGLVTTDDNLKTLMYEDNAKALRRSEMAKTCEDREVFSHENITLYFEDLPKIISILIDKELNVVKSEKLLKRSINCFSKDEEIIYNKWVDLLKNKIAKIYNDSGKVCTEKMQENIAEEYAVYLKSIFTPITVTYTITYNDFNKIIAVFENYIGKEKHTDFENKLSAALIEFVLKLKELPYYDKELAKAKKGISLFTNNNIEEYYGDVYSTSYKSSFDCLSNLILDKNINYECKLIEGEYYIPEIIADNKDLSELWLSDIMTIGNYPLATMVEINERGNLDNFMEKLSRIPNTACQFEYSTICKDVLKKYEYSLRLKMHSRAEELIEYNK